MIRDILDHPEGAAIDAEVVVVGSGIAGAEVATTLARRGRDVVILESGRTAFEPAIQALNAIEFLGKPHRPSDPEASYQKYLPAELRGVSRLRQLGGTSNVWTGKWKPFEPTDFEPRPWIPNTGWPLRRDDLEPFYRATAADYGLGDFAAEARRPEVQALRAAVEKAGLKMGSFYWEAVPTRTPARFAADLAGDALRVVTGATVTGLELDPAGRRVAEVVARSLEGRTIRARAGAVVLATGALEGPRILLASNRQRPAGIGNEHDLVGRFYTDHPKHHSGELIPGPLVRAFARELQYGPKPRFCVSFALADEVQRERRLLEHSVYLKPLYAGRAGRLGALLKGRRPARDGRGHATRYKVLVVSEQVPTRDSRVTLGPERDALGVPKLQLDWRLTDQDAASLREVVDQLTRRFAAAGLGRFDFGDAPPSLDIMTDAAHQMGATRMGANPREGVVDVDCKVFGVDNLYIVSSSVFPCGPTYSPTFTILALARRLAERLASQEVGRATALAG
jgi:choline dehydrogenase-like flavoprotein